MHKTLFILCITVLATLPLRAETQQSPGDPVHGDAKMKVIHLAAIEGDNSGAILKALNDLSSASGGTLQLSAEKYLCLAGQPIALDPKRRPSIATQKIQNVTIDGQGATLVGRDLQGLFLFYEARNITLRNLTIDWDPLPHTSGKVVNVIPSEHAFDIEPLIPKTSQAGRIVQAMLAYDPTRHRLAENGWEIYQTQGERDADPTQLLPNGTLRIFQKRGTALPEVGWNIIARHQVYSFDAFCFAMCENIVMENVTIHAAPGMGIVGYQSTNITLKHLKVVPAADGWMSTTADATHFNGCRGTIEIEDSQFAGMGDDAVNIHGMYGLVTDKIDERTLAIARGRMHPYYDKVRVEWDLPRAGDVLEFGSGDQPLLPQGSIVVDEAHQDAKLGRTIVKCREPLPKDFAAGYVLANISACPIVRINRCFVHGNRARGMLLQSREVSVIGCRFEDISGAGIHICADADEWWESVGSKNVTIADCTFRRCNFGVARGSSVLDVFSALPGGKLSAAGVHQLLNIHDNLFEENTGHAIRLCSTGKADVRNNRLSVNDQTAAIKITHCREFSIAGNKLIKGKIGIVMKDNPELGVHFIQNDFGLCQSDQP